MNRRSMMCRASVAVATCLALPACAAFTPIPADEAVAHYDAAIADVVEVLGEAGLTYGEPRQREVTETNGLCYFTAGHYDTIETHPRSYLSSEVDFEGTYEAALSEVLAEHGYGDLRQDEADGPYPGWKAVDAHGGVFTLSVNGGFSFYRILVDASPCDGSALGLDA